MYILLAVLSTLPRENNPISYSIRIEECAEKKINAVYTNESILACVANMNSIRERFGMEKVIALTSYDVLYRQVPHFDNKTAWEYYKAKVATLLGDKCNLKHIPIEDENKTERKMSEILSDICSEIDPTDVVFIDNAGGQRTISNLIVQLANILKYTGVKTPYTLYANVQNRENGFITDTAEYVRMANLADAFNEFMTAGKAEQLRRYCTEASIDTRFQGLLQNMTDFSERILIGDMVGLDKAITDLKNNLSMCRNTVDDNNSIEVVILRQFIPIIQEKLLGNMSKGIDYVQLITWCLENGLVLQALTIFVEKIGVYLFQKKIITYNGDDKLARHDHELNRSALDHAEWESFVLYTDILSDKNNNPAADPLTESLRSLLENRTVLSNETNEKVKDVYNAIMSFERHYWLDFSKNETKQKIIDIRNKNKQWTRFDSMLKGMIGQSNTLASLLGKPSKNRKNKDNNELKLDKIHEYLTTKVPTNSNYRIATTPEKFAAILYGAIYVKACRNKVVHTSSDENLSDVVTAKLTECGYRFNDYSLQTVIENVKVALKAIQDALPDTKETETRNNMEDTPLIHNVGDTIEATLISQKCVKLSQYDYTSQLVVPKGYQQQLYIGQTVTVVIRQISRKKVICQVEILQ